MAETADNLPEPLGAAQEEANDELMPLIDDVGEPTLPPVEAAGSAPSDTEAAGDLPQPAEPTATLEPTSFKRSTRHTAADGGADLQQVDELAVPFVSDAEAAPHGRSSHDSHALASCSSGALTTEHLMSDDEDVGGRSRSGWPLMLRSRYGTPGPAPQRLSDESTADGSPHIAAAFGGEALSLSMGAEQLHAEPEAVETAGGAIEHEPDAALGMPMPSPHEQLPSADDRPLPPADMSEAVEADDSTRPSQAEEWPAVAADASSDSSVPEPPGSTEAAPTAAEGPAADQLRDGAGVEHDGSGWQLPAPSSSLPVAALAARYNRSLTSPAAVCV